MQLSKQVIYLYKKISIQYKITFYSAIVIGMIAHMPILTNVLVNYDSASMIPRGYGTGIQSGRFMLTLMGEFMERFWGDFNLPFINSFVAIIILALCVTAIVFILGIKDNLFCFLCGGLFISFPAITCTLFFTYTSGYYAVAILITVLAVLLADKYNKILIPGVLLAFSLGIYQAYYPLAAGLFLLVLVKKCYYAPNDYKENIKKAFSFFAILVIGLILYFIMQRIMQNMLGITLNTYQGISEMGNLKMTDIPDSILKAYRVYIQLPWKEYCNVNYSGVVRISLMVVYLFSIITVFIFLQNKSFKFKIQIILLLVLFPLAANGIEIMCNENSIIYSLMVLPLSLIYILPIFLLEFVNDEWEHSKNFKKSSHKLMVKTVNYILPVVMVIIMSNYIWGANGNYTAMFYTNQQTTGYFNGLVNRIKGMDGYNTNMPLAIIGERINDPSFHNIWGDSPFHWGGNSAYLIGIYSQNIYIRAFTGYTLPLVSKEEQMKITQNSFVMEMPYYPNDGSIAIVDGVIVVKLSE